ncbi:hypothetical protein BH23VER1_BH23VER1_30460 [soil metagenome]
MGAAGLAVTGWAGGADAPETERSPAEWQRLGVERFEAGDAAGSVAAFDAYLAARPDALPHHWQRGISLYYAGDFEEGVKQFEAHQTVNAQDIENAAWHFLCVARASDIGEARKRILPQGRDPRVPLSEVYALYAGTGTPEAVLEAAKAGEPDAEALRNQLCYAHLYLGLYYEVAGDAERSRQHIEEASETYAMPHYMGKVAQVHRKSFKVED